MVVGIGCLGAPYFVWIGCLSSFAESHQMQQKNVEVSPCMTLKGRYGQLGSIRVFSESATKKIKLEVQNATDKSISQV